MRKNPRTTKIEKVTLKEVSSDSEASENSISDEPNSPENEAIDYEKQRKLRIAENNARMEAMGLQTIANSLMKLGGKRKKGVKNGKEDDEYEPTDDDDDDEVKDDDSDSSSSDECRKKKKMKKKQKQKQKEKANATTSVSQRVEHPPGVFIPDSSLHAIGHCGEKIYLVFPKASKEKVKDLVDRYPEGFNGFNREQGEKALRRIADLKAECWKLRRSYMWWYPEFREEGVEGLPFPEGFNGFNLEQSKEISRVLLTLENVYTRLKKCFQPNMHEVAKGVQRPEVAPGFYPMGTSYPPPTHASCPQQQASTFIPGPVQANAPMFPGHMQFSPYWCPPPIPFGMAPIPWNPPPFAGSYPGMSWF